eukprot:6818551-Lingulodinium_polyedra.AAC.1
MPGWRQQAAAASSSAARSRSPPGQTAVETPVLGNQLSAWLFAWAWGRKSASDIVRDAHAYALDNAAGEIPVPIKRLARTWTNIKNAERVVESLLPKARLVDIDPIADSSVDSVLLPYNTFHWLRTKHPR